MEINYFLKQINKGRRKVAQLLLLSLDFIDKYKVLENFPFIKDRINNDLVTKFNNNIKLLNDSEKNKALLLTENAFLINNEFYIIKKMILI